MKFANILTLKFLLVPLAFGLPRFHGSQNDLGQRSEASQDQVLSDPIGTHQLSRRVVSELGWVGQHEAFNGDLKANNLGFVAFNKEGNLVYFVNVVRKPEGKSEEVLEQEMDALYKALSPIYPDAGFVGSKYDDRVIIFWLMPASIKENVFDYLQEFFENRKNIKLLPIIYACGYDTTDGKLQVEMSIDRELTVNGKVLWKDGKETATPVA